MRHIDTNRTRDRYMKKNVRQRKREYLENVQDIEMEKLTY